jgi:hypothetical protein
MDLVIKALTLKSKIAENDLLFVFWRNVTEPLINSFKSSKTEKYKYLEYLTYHIFAGSTPIKNQIKYFDFDGENSLILKAEEFLKKRNCLVIYLLNIERLVCF